MPSRGELLARALVCTTNPSAYHGGIPTSYQGELVQQRALASINLPVGTGVGDAPETGAILINYARGYDFYVYMSVPEYFTAASGVVSVPMATLVPALINTIVTVTSTSGPALSKLFAYPAGSPVLEPQLQRLVSVGRVASAAIRVKSSTTSTTVAALSGILAAAAFADFRTCYSLANTNIATSSMTPKDMLLNVRAFDGVVAVIGPDVIPSVKAISYSRIAQAKEYALGDVIIGPFPDANVLALSPWTLPTTNMAYDTFSTVPLQTLPRPFWLGSRLSLVYNVPNGVLGFYKLRVTPLYFNVTFNSPTGWSLYSLPTFFVDIVVNAASYTQEVVFEVDDPPVGYGFFGWAVSADTASGLTFQAYREDIPDLYQPANIGALRAIRWNSLGADQTLSIEIRSVIEAVPAGDIAKVITQQPEVGVGVAGAFTALRMLYGDVSCPLARVMTDPVYQAIISDPGKWVCSNEVASTISETSGDRPRAPPFAGELELTRGAELGALALAARRDAEENQDALPNQLSGFASARATRAGAAMGAPPVFGSAAGMYGAAAGMYGSAAVRKRGRSALSNVLGDVAGLALNAVPAILGSII